MVENKKTIITLEEGEEFVVDGVTLTAGMSFEILEADKKTDDKRAKTDADREKDMDKVDKEDDSEEMDEKKKKESVIYTVEEDVKVGDVILEKGDRFEVLEVEAPDSSKDGEKAKDSEKKDKEKEESTIYTVEEDTQIPGTDIVLEKGDKFTVL